MEPHGYTAIGKLLHVGGGREPGVAGGGLVVLRGHLFHDELVGWHTGPLGLTIEPSPLVHCLDEWRRPMGRVQGHKRQPAYLHPLHDRLAHLRLHGGLLLVTPPKHHLGEIEDLLREPLLGIVEAERPHVKPRLGPKVVGDAVAEEVVVGLLLAGLLLIPHHDADRGLGRARHPGHDQARRHCHRLNRPSHALHAPMRKRVGPLRIASSREACILRGDVDTHPEMRSCRSTARFIHGLRGRLASGQVTHRIC